MSLREYEIKTLAFSTGCACSTSVTRPFPAVTDTNKLAAGSRRGRGATTDAYRLPASAPEKEHPRVSHVNPASRQTGGERPGQENDRGAPHRIVEGAVHIAATLRDVSNVRHCRSLSTLARAWQTAAPAAIDLAVRLISLNLRPRRAARQARGGATAGRQRVSRWDGGPATRALRPALPRAARALRSAPSMRGAWRRPRSPRRPAPPADDADARAARRLTARSCPQGPARP